MPGLISEYFSDDQFQQELDDLVSHFFPLEREYKGLTPTILVISMLPSMTLRHDLFLPQQFDSDDSKATTMHLLAQHFFEQKLAPVALFTLSEAWVIARTAGSPITERPSEAADRFEAVIAAGSTADQRFVLSHSPIYRSDGKAGLGKISTQTFFNPDDNGQTAFKPFLLQEFWQSFAALSVQAHPATTTH